MTDQELMLTPEERLFGSDLVRAKLLACALYGAVLSEQQYYALANIIDSQTQEILALQERERCRHRLRQLRRQLLCLDLKALAIVLLLAIVGWMLVSHG